MSNTYRCEQWGYSGNLRTECFFRKGKNIGEVLEYIHMFQWPKNGYWVVTNIHDEEDCYPAKQEYEYCEYSY